MPNVLNLQNGVERFNICLESDGDLSFKANAENCAGNTRLTIKDDSGNVGIGTASPVAKLQILHQPQNANGNSLILGPTNASNLRLGYDTDYSWVQSHGSKPLAINPIGNNVGIGTTSSVAKLQIIHQSQDANGNSLILGPTNASNLRLGYHNDYSWVQSHGSKPLALNPLGNNVGIGTTSPTQKLHVAGNICYTGTIGACSDLRYKTDIEPLADSLNKVLSMHGMRYQWNQEAFPNHGFGEEPQIGFSGQEVEAICPEVVTTDSEGYKYLDYSRLTPVLVEAIKEQQQLIKQQKSALGEALAKIAQLEVTVQNMSADS